MFWRKLARDFHFKKFLFEWFVDMQQKYKLNEWKRGTQYVLRSQ